MHKLRSTKLPLLAAVLLAAAVATALALSRGGSPAGPPAAAQTHTAEHAVDGAHQAPTTVRTLAVYTADEPAPSTDPRQLSALIVKGKLPRRQVKATVLTDENCEPDATGLSRCRNQLELRNGRKLTVRHPHRMHDVPCMTPGETVRVGPAAKV